LIFVRVVIKRSPIDMWQFYVFFYVCGQMQWDFLCHYIANPHIRWGDCICA
jgi:hypothetical protein